MIRCTPLRPGSVVSICRVPGPSFTGDYFCRACARELLYAARRPTRDIKPVRWLTVEELYSRPGVEQRRAAVIR